MGWGWDELVEEDKMNLRFEKDTDLQTSLCAKLADDDGS